MRSRQWKMTRFWAKAIVLIIVVCMVSYGIATVSVQILPQPAGLLFLFVSLGLIHLLGRVNGGRPPLWLKKYFGDDAGW